MTTLLWCFPHEMRAAIRYRDKHPDDRLRIRNASRIDLERDKENGDRILAGTYCYGRIAKMYAPQPVEEVWLPPEYRHEVRAVLHGWQLYERRHREWVEVGEPQRTVEDAWGILDKTELGL